MLRNILVALDGSRASAAALGAAVVMQRSYGAHLTGFIAHPGVPASENTWLPEAILTTLRRSTHDAAGVVERSFRSATEGLEADRVHLVSNQNASDTSVAAASRFFDVTLVGIPAEGDTAPAFHPDHIALMSGRPVIAFPNGFKTDRIATRAMIAWDGSRAAARALSSAVRILDTKEEITIVTVGKPPKAETAVPGLDPATALERQGLSATWRHVPRNRDGIAATLLATADEIGAEVIVMGAFEHSKFREDLFGGVTHDVMAETQVPVFLAH
jgi:nucleotide-binding universal stress UspA family protein